MDKRDVTFHRKDYRAKGRTKHNTTILIANECIRRFLLHELPSGFHRIRHYGLLANAERRDHLAQVRELLQVVAKPRGTDAEALEKVIQPTFFWPDCGATIFVVEILPRKPLIRAPPPQEAAP